MLMFVGTLAAQARISFEQAMPAINAVGSSLPADLSWPDAAGDGVAVAGVGRAARS